MDGKTLQKSVDMVYFLDTNIFTRIAIEDDPRMTLECRELIEKARRGKIEIITSNIIIIEFGWLLKSYYKKDRTKTAEFLAGIFKLKGLKITGELDISRAITLYKNKNIDLTDALIASIPQIAAKEWTIVSYDEDFKKLPVLWKKPSALVA